MFESVSIKNFRGIKKLDFKGLSHLNIIVGENNSGKTTFLEALFLLTGVSNSQLPLKINSFRYFDLIGDVSWKSFFTNLDLSNKILLEASFKDKSKRILKIKPHSLVKQTLKDKDELTASSTSNPDINGLIFEAKISNGDKKSISSEIWVDIENKKQPLITSLAKDYKELRRAIFLSDRTIPIEFANRFDNIQRRKEENKVIEILRNIEPNLKNIRLGQEGIIYVDLGLDNLVPLQLMGDGMVRILAIVLAIMDTRDGLVLIDEVENGLHYKSQGVLWSAILQTAEKYNVQIIASTHSIETINALRTTIQSKNKKMLKLLRIENENGIAKVIDFPQNKIIEFLENNWEFR